MLRALCAVGVAGALLALTGAYWDDGWHTERGRDAFLIAPHVAVYGGISLAGAVLVIWALRLWRDRRGGALRDRPALALGLGAVALTLAAGPIDNAWHLAFGRDAVIWSAPHLLGIVGSLGIATSLLLAAQEAGSRVLATVASGGVLAASSLVVMEYDTDVPQFSPVWYLPVLGVAAAVGFRIVASSLPERRWGLTQAAAVHLGLVGAVAALLAAADFPAPAAPALVLPALTLDAARRRSWSPAARALGFGSTLAAAVWVVRSALPGGVDLTGGELLLGGIVAAATAWIIDPARRRPSRLTVTSAAALLLATGSFVALTAQPAVAHDPGQGRDAGSIALQLRASGEVIAMTAWLRPPCASWTSVGIVARRAGREVRAPLRRTACTATGRLEVSSKGRWFVYAELRKDGQPVEAWLPIGVGAGRRAVDEPRRYAYVPPGRGDHPLQAIVAVFLYAVSAGFVAFILRATRRVGFVAAVEGEGLHA